MQVTFTHTFDVKVSRKRNGRCWCDAAFQGSAEATHSVALGRLTADGSIEHLGGTVSDYLYENLETIHARDGRTVRCCMDGHYYLPPRDRK